MEGWGVCLLWGEEEEEEEDAGGEENKEVRLGR